MIRNSKWILFSKYFAGECNETDIEEINKLVKRKTLYRNLFARLKEDNELIEKYKKMKTVDVDKAWNKLTSRIQAAGKDNVIQMTERPEKKYNRQTIGWIAVAASIVLIAGLFFTFRYVLNPNELPEGYTNVKATNISTPVVLPDGSKVYLNKDSKISYPEKFQKNQRSVSLTGEAFFEVVHNPQQPFVVDAGKAKVKVLGTSFSVNDRAQKNTITVFVETGKVELYQEEEENKGLVIEPGYVGQLTSDSQEKFLNTNNNIIAWKTKKIVFNNTRLSEVVKVLENVYGEKIRLENKEARDWRFTSPFDNQDIQSVLKVLVTTFQFKIKKTQNGYILSGGISGVN